MDGASKAKFTYLKDLSTKIGTQIATAAQRNVMSEAQFKLIKDKLFI